MTAPGWFHPESIPNRDGLLIVVIDRLGRVVSTSVVKGNDGMHRLADVEFRDVVGWRLP